MGCERVAEQRGVSWCHTCSMHDHRDRVPDLVHPGRRDFGRLQSARSRSDATDNAAACLSPGCWSHILLHEAAG
jgi:hypothetical protein